MSYSQTGMYPAKKNCPAFTDVWRWHLAIQNIKTTGELGRSVKFNQSGWEKYCIQARAALSFLAYIAKPQSPN